MRINPAEKTAEGHANTTFFESKEIIPKSFGSPQGNKGNSISFKPLSHKACTCIFFSDSCHMWVVQRTAAVIRSTPLGWAKVVLLEVYHYELLAWAVVLTTLTMFTSAQARKRSVTSLSFRSVSSLLGFSAENNSLLNPATSRKCIKI